MSDNLIGYKQPLFIGSKKQNGRYGGQLIVEKQSKLQ